MKNIKIKRNLGFTLIELITVVSVLAILITAGMTIFYRALRGSSRVEVQKSLDTEAQHVINSMSRLIRESEIVFVDGSSRDICFSSQTVSGSSLTVADIDGNTTTYSLSNGRIASNSAFLSSVEVDLSHLSFEWKCKSNSFDSLNVGFDASVVGDDGSTSADGSYSFDLLIRNSAY
jgi:prepilin-type N-terminal cleavage/methylation domain-containing protein